MTAHTAAPQPVTQGLRRSDSQVYESPECVLTPPGGYHVIALAKPGHLHVIPI